MTLLRIKNRISRLTARRSAFLAAGHPFLTSLMPAEAFASGDKDGWKYSWDLFYDEQQQAADAARALASVRGSHALLHHPVAERQARSGTAAGPGRHLRGPHGRPRLSRLITRRSGG